MKRIIVLLLLSLMSVGAFAKGGHKISRPVTDQISIDDDDIDKDRIALNIEQDSYIFNQTQYINPMLTYSTHGWDIGIAAQNILEYEHTSSSQSAQNFTNDTYLNISKTFKYEDLYGLSDEWSDKLDFLSTTFGSQTGTVFPMSTSVSPGHLDSSTIHQFYFIDTDAEILKDKVSVHYGPYYSNAALTTTTSYFGWQGGMEVMLIHKKLKLDLTEYSGHSNVSGSVFTLTWICNKNVELFTGMGLAAHNSGNYNYAITGINLIKLFEK